jgi:uncharacterized membrane protein YeaQ/YmgE (transglycosylase-associated protein family)
MGFGRSYFIATGKNAMGLPLYISENLGFIAVVVGIVAFPIAWISDMILKGQGFGVIGNYLFIIVGAYLGAIGLFYYFQTAVVILKQPEVPFCWSCCRCCGVPFACLPH